MQKSNERELLIQCHSIKDLDLILSSSKIQLKFLEILKLKSHRVWTGDCYDLKFPTDFKDLFRKELLSL